MEALIQVLLTLLVLVILWYIVRLAAAALGIPEPIVHIVALILGLVFLVYVLRLFGVAFPRW